MENRIAKVQGILSSSQAAVCTTTANCQYLTGFDFTDGCVVITKNRAVLMTDSRYIEAASKQVKHISCVCCHQLTDTVQTFLKDQQVEQVFLEMEISVAAYGVWRKLPITVTPSQVLTDTLRSARTIKDKNEIAALKKAQEITEQGFAHILPFLKQGISEREAALELEFFMRRQGSEGVSFDFIVVSGKNSSLPHGVPGDKKIQDGDFVTLDFGAVYDGYHADMTRTVAIGSVSDEQKKVYDTVLGAQKNGLSVLRAGISGKEADLAARQVIEKAGYGKYFGHGTGHGVGLEIHEAPRLSPLSFDVSLPAGAVVTVEPGIYIPEKFGVRIEDMVVLTDNGIENLTKAKKELIIL